MACAGSHSGVGALTGEVYIQQRKALAELEGPAAALKPLLDYCHTLKRRAASVVTHRVVLAFVQYVPRRVCVRNRCRQRWPATLTARGTLCTYTRGA